MNLGRGHSHQLADRLDHLTAGRVEAAQQITAAARTAGASGVLLIGSLADHTGDAFSDLDLLIIVPAHGYTGLDLVGMFGPQIVAQVNAPNTGRIGGTSTSVCLSQGDLVLWVDLVQWPIATAVVPADSLILYLRHDLPYSQLGYRRLCADHDETPAALGSLTAATVLQHVAVAARHLARGNRCGIVEHFPQAAGLPMDGIGPLLHRQLSVIDETGMHRAVAGTAALIDAAETNYRRTNL